MTYSSKCLDWFRTIQQCSHQKNQKKKRYSVSISSEKIVDMLVRRVLIKTGNEVLMIVQNLENVKNGFVF